MEKSEKKKDSKKNSLSRSVRPKNPIDIYRRKELNLHLKYQLFEDFNSNIAYRAKS